MKQTETPAFKKWFGKSKVVDASGKPLVVYHGTTGNFWTFETRIRGAYFTISPEEAFDYAERQTHPSYGKNLKPRVISAYLRVEKPFDPNVNTLPGVDLKTGTWGELEPHFKKIKSAGYDGVLVKEMSDTPDYWRDWAVFDPTQIKSATENQGTFDPADPDIRNPKRKIKRGLKKNPATPDDLPPAQGARAKSPQIDTPAFKRWFNGSVVVIQGGKPRIMYHGTGWTGIRTFGSWRSGGIAGFFAFDPAFAEDFAMAYANKDENEVDEHGVIKRPSVYPVYLSLKKVFDVRKKEDRDAVSFDQLVDRNGWVEERNGWTWTVLEEPELVRRMKQSGFDAFLDFESGSKLEPTGIAVFDPRNIKSAIGNRGTFDPADPDIRNPRRSMIRNKLSRIIEPGDRILDYDRAQGEDLYRLWDMVHTDMALSPEALVEIEGMLDDDGVLVIQSGEEPAGLRNHFRRVTRYNGMLLVQGPMNPEEARINTEKLRRDLE